MFVSVQRITSHSAPDVLRQIKLSAIEKEKARKKQEQEREAERQRFREEQRRAAAWRAEQQRRAEEQRRAAWRDEQQRVQERIKKKTLAPLPAVNDRRADIDLSQYQYDHGYKAAGVYLVADVTANEFLKDPYAAKFIRVCKVDVVKFKEKYYHLICAADSVWAWCHEQIESKALKPMEIMNKFKIVFGFPPELANTDAARCVTYRFMKYYFREWRKIWCKIRYDGNSYKAQSAEDNLWAYFKFWFCDFRMGPILCYRAQLVDEQFEFSSKPADISNKEPNYPLVDYKSIEKAIMRLHEYEKELAKQRAAKKNNNKLGGGYSKAVHKTDKYNDEEKDEYKADCGYTGSLKSNGKDKDADCDVIDDLQRTTPGDFHDELAGELPSIKTKNKHDIRQEFKRQAGSNFNHEITAGPKKTIIVKDEDNNRSSTACDKCKGNDDHNSKMTQAAVRKNDEIDEYEYSEEQQQQQQEEEEDDMSLCGVNDYTLL